MEGGHRRLMDRAASKVEGGYTELKVGGGHLSIHSEGDWAGLCGQWLR